MTTSLDLPTAPLAPVTEPTEAPGAGARRMPERQGGEKPGSETPALDPKSPVATFGADEPLAMDAGVALAPFQIAYQTAGTLNADRSNAVLICHALTGDSISPTPIRSPASAAGGRPWWGRASRWIPTATS